MLRRIVSPCAPFAASRLVDTMRLLFILKWQNSLQESKSLSRYNAASFYPEMAIFNKARQMQENYYNSGVMVNYLSGVFTGGVYYYVYFGASCTVSFI